MKIIHTLKSLTIVFGALFVFSGAAMAQTTILIVDQNKVLRDSEVGKHVQRQIESIGKQMDSELKAQVTPLVSERDKLLTELKSMSADALKSRPDLQQRAVSLQEKGEKSKLEAAYKQKELQITEQKAISKINEKLSVVLKTIVKERKADLILDRSLVIYNGKSVDITDDVISRLNSQMKTVAVTRERLPRKRPAPKK
jgi:outer membrane protein